MDGVGGLGVCDLSPPARSHPSDFLIPCAAPLLTLRIPLDHRI